MSYDFCKNSADEITLAINNDIKTSAISDTPQRKRMLSIDHESNEVIKVEKIIKINGNIIYEVIFDYDWFYKLTHTQKNNFEKIEIVVKNKYIDRSIHVECLFIKNGSLGCSQYFLKKQIYEDCIFSPDSGIDLDFPYYNELFVNCIKEI